MTSFLNQNNNWSQQVQRIWAIGLIESWLCIGDDLANPKIELNLVSNPMQSLNVGCNARTNTTIMIVLILLFCGIYMFPFMLGEGKILRNPDYFKLSIVLSLIPIISAIILLMKSEENYICESLIPISILILFKWADNYILKKFNRHFYFSKKYSLDLESKNATWLEFLIQMFIAFGPLFFWFFIGDFLS
nr:hypothetical protein [uncultured Flavobacterium sp.]